MKDKLISGSAVIVVVVACIIGLQNINAGSLFSSGSEESTFTQPINVDSAPEHVKQTIKELKAKRPHVNDICLYGAAMLINDLGNDAEAALKQESKCIHNMVIFTGQSELTSLIPKTPQPQ